MPAETRVTRLSIRKGAVGPLPACDLAVRAFTVFVGEQGSGKSLAAQLLYFFEELPFLLQFTLDTEEQARRMSDDQLVLHILDQLRSAERSFGVFFQKNTEVEWSRGARWGASDLDRSGLLGFRMPSRRRLALAPGSRQVIAELRRHLAHTNAHLWHHAIFFPTERIVAPLLRTIGATRAVSLPLTYVQFDHWLFVHGVGEEGKTFDRFERELLRILGGEAFRRGDRWKWRFRKGQMDLDLASSGQRANWSLPYLTRALRAEAGIHPVDHSVVLVVEEPEIHLHPEAQVAVVRLLARMVNLGFRVVVTTHSLDVLYAVNNLVQASRVGDDELKGIPPPEVRLKPDSVSVYRFQAGHKPKAVVERETGFISERELGRVSEGLSAEYNRIAARIAHLGRDRG